MSACGGAERRRQRAQVVDSVKLDLDTAGLAAARAHDPDLRLVRVASLSSADRLGSMLGYRRLRRASIRRARAAPPRPTFPRRAPKSARRSAGRQPSVLGRSDREQRAPDQRSSRPVRSFPALQAGEESIARHVRRLADTRGDLVVAHPGSARSRSKPCASSTGFKSAHQVFDQLIRALHGRRVRAPPSARR